MEFLLEKDYNYINHKNGGQHMTKKGVTIYFMRHGETVFNRYNRMQGWSDTPLTKEGRLDAIRSGLGAADIHFDAVYTSDLRRTVETAQLFLRNHPDRDKLTIEMMPEFREVYFGSLEGLDSAELWGELYKKLQRNFSDLGGRNIHEELNGLKELDPDHLGENFTEFWSRVEKGLLKVLSKHRETNHNVLVVSHGMAIRNMLHELIPDFQLSELIGNASLNIVEYSDGHFTLKALNQTHHFALRKDAQEEEFDLLPMKMYE